MRRILGSTVMGWVLLGVAWGGAPDAFEHVDLDAILQATVHGEGVDYGRIREAHLAQLDGYLGRLAEFDAGVLPRKERLALLINLYNATMIRAVVERLAPGYSPSDEGFKVFDEDRVRLGGKRFSLNHLEHKIIRPGFRDPRIHAALVCAARSCPPLIPRAYRAADLDTILDDNMRRFVNDRTRNRVDPAGRALHLSRIFEWYAEDFGGPDNLPAYIARYNRQAVAGFSVTYLPYSWDLNLARPAR